MKERNLREIILKAFLSLCSPDKKKHLEKFLSPSEQQKLEKMPPFPKERGIDPQISLEQIHWSWFIPTLKTYSTREQKLFLSALNPEVSLALSQELGFSSPPKEELTAEGADFLQEMLLSHLVGHRSRLIPPSYLPASSLQPLLHLNKKNLIRLVDFLSLYDLAAELRQIVETKILKKIYSLLTGEQKRLLKMAMTQKEPYPLPRLKLEKWDGSEDTLRLLLHKRGLARLGVALSAQDPDLAWYVCHRLDIGRGNALFKLCATEAATDISEGITRQIEELLANKELFA
jgi:hypothetical protein